MSTGSFQQGRTEDRSKTLTSYNIPEVDKPVSPSSGQEAAVGAKTNSIDLREMSVL